MHAFWKSTIFLLDLLQIDISLKLDCFLVFVEIWVLFSRNALNLEVVVLYLNLIIQFLEVFESGPEIFRSSFKFLSLLLLLGELLSQVSCFRVEIRVSFREILVLYLKSLDLFGQLIYLHHIIKEVILFNHLRSILQNLHIIKSNLFHNFLTHLFLFFFDFLLAAQYLLHSFLQFFIIHQDLWSWLISLQRIEILIFDLVQQTCLFHLINFIKTFKNSFERIWDFIKERTSVFSQFWLANFDKRRWVWRNSCLILRGSLFPFRIKSSDHYGYNVSLLLSIELYRDWFISCQLDLNRLINFSDDVDLRKFLIKIDHDHLFLIRRLEQKGTVPYIDHNFSHWYSRVIRLDNRHIFKIPVLLIVIDNVLRSTEHPVIHDQRPYLPKQRHS